jgi:hypothetical protein
VATVKEVLVNEVVALTRARAETRLRERADALATENAHLKQLLAEACRRDQRLMADVRRACALRLWNRRCRAA